MNKFIIGFLAIAFAINAAMGLKCYKCDSSTSSFCDYGGLTSYTYPSVNCEGDGGILFSLIPKECVKIVGKDEKGKQHVARDCFPATGGLCNAAVKTLGVFSNVKIADVGCYTCNSDNCNSAEKIKGLALFGLILAIFVSMF